MKDLLNRLARALDLAVRHLEENSSRPLSPDVVDLIAEGNAAVDEVAKVPRLLGDDVAALERIFNKSRARTGRMPAQRALLFLRTHAGTQRRDT